MNRMEYWIRLTGISLLVPLAFVENIGALAAFGVVILVGWLNLRRGRATGRENLGWAATMSFGALASLLMTAIHLAPLADPFADLFGIAYVALFGTWMISTLIVGGVLTKDRYEVTS